MPIDAFGGALNAAIKYNPHLWGADELRAIFVVRQTDLASIMEAVQDAKPDVVPQHMLICGHRGMGKSTLLRRIALAVNDDPALAAKWLPLNFPEEQYTVRTLTEFLLNLLDVLADTLEQAGAEPDELAGIDNKIAEISALAAEQAESAALDYLAQWVKAHGKGLLLLVDSSDMLLNSLAQGEGKAAGSGNASALWRLRRVLSHQPGLFWIGASYQALESQHQYQDAFHDFFALHELRPLSVEEMRLALLALARRFGVGRAFEGEAAANEMARILDSKPERLKTLRLLSGGNPRTMVTLFELFSAGGEESIHADLKRLLDVMTPLYKARMEALSEQARKILAHLMESWNPVGVRELEVQSGISGTTISGQLTRLEQEGLIEKASLGGTAKRSGFQVAERFFNVWYLMRYGTRRLRQRLTWAVQFMRLWYSREELASLAGMRARRHAAGKLNDSTNLEFSRAISGAMDGGDQNAVVLDWAVLSAAHRETCQTRQAIGEILPEMLFELDGADSRFKEGADYLRRFTALEASLMTCSHASPHERQDWARDVLGSRSMSLGEKEMLGRQVEAGELPREQYENLRRIFAEERESLVARYGESGKAFYSAISEGRFPTEFANSEVAYAQIEHCFADDPVAYKLAFSLFRRRMRDVWGGRSLRRAIEINPGDAELRFWLGWLLQECLARPEESEAAYRQAIALDGTDALPWNNLGYLLANQLKRYDEAEAAYRQAIELDANNPYAVMNLARLKVVQGESQSATTLYRQALPLADDDHLRLQVHLWLGNRDSAMQALNALATDAVNGSGLAFFRLREQAWECHGIGRGEALAALMAESPLAEFLLPFRLALAAAASGVLPMGVAPEIASLANEVLAEIKQRA